VKNEKNILLNKIENLSNNFIVLYIDNNPKEEDLIIFKKIFKKVFLAKNFNDAKDILKNNININLIISEIIINNKSGFEIINYFKSINKDFLSIIYTKNINLKELKKGLEIEINDFLCKELNLNEFLKTLKILNNKLKKEKELTKINKSFEDILKYIKHKQFKEIILIDIFNFSIFNQIYGKIYCDKILLEIYNILKQLENKNISVFKIESDKYLILSKNNNYEEIIFKIENELFKKGIIINKKGVNINFNYGIANLDHNINDLIKAEYALKLAKINNNINYSFYDPNHYIIKKEEESSKWFSITKELIDTKNINPVYQPILNIKTGKIDKYEVLARGFYQGKDLAPFFFIPAAEKLNLITEITKLIIEKSFKFFRKTNYNFSINISAKDLKDNYLELFLKDKCKEFDIKPENVTLEILENITLANESQNIIKQINNLKSQNFKIAIDDFGADNSNFARLLDIDCDYIKIDMLFIKNIEKNIKYQLIVKAIVNLAKTLNLKTVAEYVENEEILKIITECGVDYAQGYFIGKPKKELIN